MNQEIINYAVAGVLGGCFGAGVAFFAHRYKLYKDKKNRLSDIQKQSIVDFQIPVITNGKASQQKVNLHELVGLKEKESKEIKEVENDNSMNQTFEDFDNEEINPDEEYNEYVMSESDEIGEELEDYYDLDEETENNAKNSDDKIK